MRRLAAILVCMLGIFLMLLGIGRMSWWAPSDVSEITINAETTQNAPFVVLDNDVRKELQSPIQVEIKDAGNFSVSQGRKEDTLAWLGGVKHATATRIEKDEFAVEVAGDQPSAPDPLGADIWYESNIGQKEYSGRWESPKNGEWNLVIASDGRNKAPSEVKISSPRHVGFVIPILLLVFGGILFIVGLLGAIFVPKKPSSGSASPRDSRTKVRDSYSARHRPSSKARVPSSRNVRPSARRRYSMVAVSSLALIAIFLAPASAAQDKSEANGVVEGTQLQRIIDNIGKVVARSEQSLKVDDLDTRLAQPELSLRAANYAVRREIPSHPALSPISSNGDEGFGIVRRYIQESRQWPRTISMVTQGGQDQNAQYIVISQQNARSNYKVNQVIPVVQGQTALGAKQLPPQSVTWLSGDDKIEDLKSPQEALGIFAALLNDDESARDQFVPNDAVLTQVASQNRIDEGAELVRPIANTVNKAETKAFESVDGDLLISGIVETTISQRPKQGKVIKLPPQQRVLAGTEEVTGTVTIQTAEPVVIVVPRDGGPLQVISFSRSYLRVTAE